MPIVTAQLSNLLAQTTHKVVAIGASTGGTKAIEMVLSSMPATAPGVVVVQHMPQNFTTSFAKRLNEICQMEVREARDNDCVATGTALIAPGNRHMLLNRKGGSYLVNIKTVPGFTISGPVSMYYSSRWLNMPEEMPLAFY